MTIRTLYHTSPRQIDRVTCDGLLGSGLCFSSDVYVMTAVQDYVTYSIDIDESQILDARRMWFIPDSHLTCADEIAEMMQAAECDEDTAMALLDESRHVFDGMYDYDCHLELSDVAWERQRISLRCAVKLGYRGVAGRDEQGVVYIIDMIDRESDLRIVP